MSDPFNAGGRAPQTPGEDMYREHILDHYKHPRNFGVLKPASVDHEANNPLCGDQIRITFNVNERDEVSDVKFTGRGCAISQASASLLTTRVKGKTLADVKALTRDDVVQMLGIPVSPVRLKCALLSLAVLREGVEIYEKKLGEASPS
ncbi:MAG TPA: SUF system NifU family Fe-S cluster assembly protein [Candidatus Thermoplasmatota archaeon]|nr:SUF system NifU family Fe-S cluster assembly protein [Candidatus Thermoplasmatota archaeon]